MGKCLETFAVLCVGCGGLASTQSEAPSQPSSDDTVCAVTDGSIEAAWGGTALTLSGTCDGVPMKFAYIGGAFELCVRDESGLTLVLGDVGGAPGQDGWAQLYPWRGDQWWVAGSVPGFALTVTALRPPGHYVEGTFTGLVRRDTPTGAPTGPAKSLSGSFKVCRGADEPLPN
jgi:hypothetical protein